MEVSKLTRDNLKWRIDIVISSRDTSRILEPIIYLEFTLDSGKPISVETPISKFHSLRHSVALLLKEIDLTTQRLSQIKNIPQ